ncbi:unnamed protein product, partial [marine sediment metagenome]
RNGTAIHAISVLAREACEDHQHWGADSGQPLKAKRGALVARAATAGWKVAWRHWEPPLPHEKPNPHETDGRVIVGLSGLNISLTDGNLDFTKMPSTDARLACRYAVNELNGFADWLPELAKDHPDIVRTVLGECIRGEWRIPADREHVNEVLSSLRYHAKGMGYLVADDILKELQA